MKGTYARTYKKAPVQVRSMQCDDWHCSELAFPESFKPQSGGSPRGNGVRFHDVHKYQDRGGVLSCL